ncbi:MAG: hypothetical protein V2I48_07740 [Xanthomonadales bacterium]|jgi:protein-S-isoprenylcysteine O-methyltransferase Ste14|nr:hypothetical protein [Xanthomonadales bacterium]
MTDLLALGVLVSVIALLYARREYPRRGHLTLFGLFLLCTMLFLPILMIDQVTRYTPPVTWVDYLGLIIAITGLALCLAALLVTAVSLHYLVLIEEQHQRSVFGEPYVEFCHNVPRYWSWRR